IRWTRSSQAATPPAGGSIRKAVLNSAQLTLPFVIATPPASRTPRWRAGDAARARAREERAWAWAITRAPQKRRTRHHRIPTHPPGARPPGHAAALRVSAADAVALRPGDGGRYHARHQHRRHRASHPGCSAAAVRADRSVDGWLSRLRDPAPGAGAGVAPGV